MPQTKEPTAFDAAIGEIDRRIGELQRTKETLLALRDGAGSVPLAQSPPVGLRTETGDALLLVREQEFHGMSAAVAAQAFLRRIGAAEKTQTILAAIHKGGVSFGGKNPTSALYTTLARHSAFVSLKKNWWDLAERRPDLAGEQREQKRRTNAPRKRRLRKKPVAQEQQQMPVGAKG